MTSQTAYQAPPTFPETPKREANAILLHIISVSEGKRGRKGDGDEKVLYFVFFFQTLRSSGRPLTSHQDLKRRR